MRLGILAALALAALTQIPNPTATAQEQTRPDIPGAPAGDISNIPKGITETFDRFNVGNARNQPSRRGQNAFSQNDACLLPPLTFMRAASVSAQQLQIPLKARKEYGEACTVLRKNKMAEAESHLRKAVEEFPKYAAAWVTLGQVLAGLQRMEEARNACTQAAAADPSYVPSYLCLADVAARLHAWEDVLKLSAHALALDRVTDPIAYEYDAVANLKLHNLAEAEKSAMRAVNIDSDHHEPRIFFVLAQIYEAKGDVTNEVAQLRQYVKYVKNSDDVAAIQQWIAKLEPPRNVERTDLSTRNPTANFPAMARTWGPPDVDEVIPPADGNSACPLPQILTETSKRTLDLIDNLQRFSASERIEQTDTDKHGKSRTANAQVVNYVAQIQQNSSGYPSIKEYRVGGDASRRLSLVDTGTAALALIFHPSHLGNFDFRCEGATQLQSTPAYQLHFEERADPNQAFQAIQVENSMYLPRLKGRAWISVDAYDVIRIETDLVAPVPKIDLQLEHFLVSYAPVDFESRHVRLWLPQSASLYLAYRGHRYQRLHTFSDFQLFSVDAAQAVKEPVTPDKKPRYFARR